MATYTYSKAGVIPSRLVREILSSSPAITSSTLSATPVEDSDPTNPTPTNNLNIYFVGTLSAGDITQLGVIVAAHPAASSAVPITGDPIRVDDTAGGDTAGTYPNPTVARSSTAFAYTGIITPTALAANTNDYAPTGLATASVIRLSSTGAVNLTGLTGGATGRVVLIHNVGASTITLVDESVASTTTNRFALTANLALSADSVVLLQYDATSSRWRACGSTGNFTGAGAVGAKGDVQFRAASAGLFAASANFNYNEQGDELTLGPGGTQLANNPLRVTGTINSYLQSNVQNTNNGGSASSDIVATSNNGNDQNNYLDLGINSSGYNDPAYDIGGASYGYLYVQDGGLTLGTGTAHPVILHVGGTTSTDEKARVDTNGDFVQGRAALATNATAGFMFIAGGAGPPTGVPTTRAGRTALYYDTTNCQLYTYCGGWKTVHSTSIAFTGIISPASFGVQQNDYNPTGLADASTLRLTPTAAVSLTGIAGGAAGRILILHNVGSFNLTLPDESASSTAANRFAISGTMGLVLRPDDCVTLQYDPTSSRWRIIGDSSPIMIGDTGAGGWRGAAPAPAAGDAAANKFLKADATWQAPTDLDAIHKSVAAEISTVTEKTNPTTSDLLLIEDAAAANAKRRVVIGNLPGATNVTFRQSVFTEITGSTTTTATTWPAATTIAAGSNGVALPTGTINVASTTGFAASGTIYVVTSAGTQTVNYTGTTATSFTGCTGGTGTMSTGGAVMAVTAQDWLSLSVTTTANAILVVHFTTAASVSNANATIFFRLVINGVVRRGAGIRMAAANGPGGATIAFRLTGVGAGTQRVVIQARVSANTGRVDPAGQPDAEHASLLVEEVTV